jgi:hypothetical protein
LICARLRRRSRRNGRSSPSAHDPPSPGSAATDDPPVFSPRFEP